MLLQSNSYVVPREKRAEHARLVRRFRQALSRLGCDQFDVFEQVGQNWSSGESTGRFVQMMRFRDRRHQQAVQTAERQDPAAQQLIAEFCELINFPYQQQQGLFAVGFYQSALPIAPQRPAAGEAEATGGEVEAEPVESEEAEPASEDRLREPDDHESPDHESENRESEDHRPGLRTVEAEEELPIGEEEPAEASRNGEEPQ